MALFAFATNPVFSHPDHDAPYSGDLDSDYGVAPAEIRLGSLLTVNTVAFEDSPKHTELHLVGWSQVHEQAIRSRYESYLQQDIDSCVEGISGVVLFFPSSDGLWNGNWPALSYGHKT